VVKGSNLRNAATPKRGQSQKDKETVRDPPWREQSGRDGMRSSKGAMRRNSMTGGGGEGVGFYFRGIYLFPVVQK